MFLDHVGVFEHAGPQFIGDALRVGVVPVEEFDGENLDLVFAQNAFKDRRMTGGQFFDALAIRDALADTAGLRLETAAGDGVGGRRNRRLHLREALLQESTGTDQLPHGPILCCTTTLYRIYEKTMLISNNL